MAKAVRPRTHASISSRDLYDVADDEVSGSSEYADLADDAGIDPELEQYPTWREAGYQRRRSTTLEASGFGGLDGGVESDDWLQAAAEERLRNAH